MRSDQILLQCRSSQSGDCLGRLSISIQVGGNLSSDQTDGVRSPSNYLQISLYCLITASPIYCSPLIKLLALTERTIIINNIQIEINYPDTEYRAQIL